ncbi:sodium:solute symporter family transporter [Microbacterium elymi]|uniref:sodium:solute symporter family transporter n=1 Tax=Microbacterium elymi TaxID=2909587 RepID=UPI0025B6FF66|nr:hypothetical protein [Microbacterium elymi]
MLTVLGLGSNTNWFMADLPLIIAFVVLAAYTYTAGLRAPALIAVVKDILIYAAIIVAIIYLPGKVGGWEGIFQAADDKLSLTNPATGNPFGAVIPGAGSFNAYWTLALGSAMALFMYPHSITGVLATKSRNTIRRNAMILPLYSLMLGGLALLGYVAIKAGTQPIDVDGSVNAQLVVPQLFSDLFPKWFAGIALAAIAIGALVPAAIMSIAASNLFTRNVYRDFFKKDATPQAGGQGLQVRVADREAGRAGVRAGDGRLVGDQPAACSAASGSCRRSRRSWPACTPDGSTGGRCSPAGPPASCMARSRRTTSSTPPRTGTSAARSRTSRSPTSRSTSGCPRSR